MPTEIGLIDGTKLHIADSNVRPDDVIQKINSRDLARAVGFVSFTTTAGDYRVRPEHIAYVRWIDEAEPAVAFSGGVN